MATARFTSLVIYDSVLFQRGGRVDRWANSLERGFVLNAKKAAPERSGELRAGISGSTTKAGPKQYLVHVHSDAGHTMYVLKGTTGPIMSRRMWAFRGRTGLDLPRGGRLGNGAPNMRWLAKNGYALKVRAGNGYAQHYALSVSGQESNNFFATAADATARRHPSLRGFNPGFRY